MPRWNATDKRRWMALAFKALVALVVVLWLALSGWVLFTPTTVMPLMALPVGADLMVVLAPVVLAAAGVERALETFFSLIESYWKTLVAYLGSGLRWLKTAEIEVIEARQWLLEMAAHYRDAMVELAIPDQLTPETLAQMQTQLANAQAMMAAAENRLKTAEQNLSQVTDSPSYKQAKGLASIILGTFLGVVTAKISALQMFALLGINMVPDNLDILLTGLVIGSGSNPIHSLVNLLQEAKNTLDGAQTFLSKYSPKK